MAPRAAELSRLVSAFDCMVDDTAPAREHQVITHGEPHPANLMSVDHRLMLIDWDTVALAPPERDLSLMSTRSGAVTAERYQRATGRQLNQAVITLYQLRWYLDDLACTVKALRGHHIDTADTARWCDGLAPRLRQIEAWSNRVGWSAG